MAEKRTRSGNSVVRKRGESRKGTQPSNRGKVVNVRADQTNWRRKLAQSRIKFDDDQKEIYLEELSRHGMRGRSAKAAHVSPQTVINHLENDPDFAAAHAAAIEEYRDSVVDHATTLALDGITVKKYNKDGVLVEERQDYPIRLIELELKKVDPAYRDKQTVDLNHAGGVMVAPPDITPEEWIRQQQEANAARQAPEGLEDR